MNKQEFVEEYFVWAQQESSLTQFRTARVRFTLVTNQVDGIVSFASSRDMGVGPLVADEELVYKHAGAIGGIGGVLRPEHFEVTCEYYFSNRLKDLGPPGRVPFGPMQPFASDQYDKINLILFADGNGDINLHIDLLTWQSSLKVSMDVIDDMLFGIGPSIGNSAPNAIYTLSLYNKYVDQS